MLYKTATAVQQVLSKSSILNDCEGHEPPVRRGCWVKLPAYDNGFCIFRASYCIAVFGVMLATSPLASWRLFFDVNKAANYMITP